MPTAARNSNSWSKNRRLHPREAGREGGGVSLSAVGHGCVELFFFKRETHAKWNFCFLYTPGFGKKTKCHGKKPTNGKKYNSSTKNNTWIQFSNAKRIVVLSCIHDSMSRLHLWVSHRSGRLPSNLAQFNAFSCFFVLQIGTSSVGTLSSPLVP